MPALVAGIHVFAAVRFAKTWMAGTSPATTRDQNALNVMIVRVS
jgi:hypothetical protein